MKTAFYKKHNRFHIVALIIFIAVLFFICAVMGISMYRSVTSELYNERSKTLNEVSEQIAKTIDTTSESTWYIAEAAFSYLLSSEIESKNDLAYILDKAEVNFNKDNNNIYLTVIDSKTNYYLSNGYTGLWKNVGFLTKSADEHQAFMTTAAFDDASEHMIFLRRLAEPKVLNDGTQITHTAMVLSAGAYTKAFSATGFNGSADVFIVHSNGRSIYRRNNTGVFSISANILRILKNVDFLHGGTFEQLMDSLSEPAGQSLEFIYEGKRYFVSFAPTQTLDWVVTLIIPTDQLQSSSQDLLNTLLYRILIIATVLILMAALIIYFFISEGSSMIRAEHQKEINAALQKAAEEATKANRAKSEFLSHMSHDLRTPLNGIMGMLEIADENRKDPETVQQCLVKIGSAANHLYSLINDVLDMSRLESGSVTLTEKPFDLRILLDSCCSIIQSSIKQGIQFTFSYSNIIHPFLTGCDLYLRQILINVLGNAVKFTKDGGSVFFGTDEISYDGHTACFRFVIRDTGIGMSAEFIDHIFEPFSQENSGSRTNYEGTGLGMSITKELIDKMGGTIEIQSNLNEGSCFTILIPLSVNECKVCTNKPSDDRSEPNNLQNMKIILAEDNALNLEIAEHMLNKSGAEVISVYNGEEAVRAFEQSANGSIDAVLMDVMMPVMDGLDATKAIRSLDRPDAAQVPIIAMTANAFAEDIKKTKESGMNGHLSKPINSKLLISELVKYKKRESR